ncbi:MAG TPA: murein biosynthesis integral membrane protein MurJ, partial [Gammaproteobacteria bacterium]|nr:murein biosynthesis integral membrane protein MurJ [Gammaproteobacteria bacterium]
LKLLPKPVFGNDKEGVARIKKLMLPALFGASVSQINLLLDTVIASLLVTGSVSWLYYSDRLMELPLGTFGIAIAIVVLPSLSRQHAESSVQAFAETLDWALRLVCLIAIPASLGLILLAEPLLITLFQNDNFPRSDVISSAGSLRAYAVGLLAFMSVKIFAPGFYARQNTSTPVRIGIIAMAINMILNITFYLAGLAHVGLALATSLAAFVNAGLLLWFLRQDQVFLWQSGWLKYLLQLGLANVAMVAFILFSADPWEVWESLSVLARVAKLAVAVGGSVIVYVLVLLLGGLRWRHIYR